MAEPVAQGVSETTRVEAFSNGIFAIAITHLVFQIRVPQPDLTGHGSTLLSALLRLWPSYLGFLISVFFLMCIAFLPFPTAVLAEYRSEPKGRRVAVALYSAAFVLIALAYDAVWWYAVRGGRLLDRNADREAVQTISKQSR